MTANNLNIADIFEQIADILDIQGGNYFRIRAYRQGARQLRGMPVDIAQYVENGQDLSKLPTIGHNLAAKIIEILETGHCATLTRLQKQSPSGLVELLHIPGLGPKRVHALYHELGVHTPEQALRAAKDGRISSLAGMGEKTQANIIYAIESQIKIKPRVKLSVAARYAEPFADYLRQVEGRKRRKRRKEGRISRKEGREGWIGGKEKRKEERKEGRKRRMDREGRMDREERKVGRKEGRKVGRKQGLEF